jgi:HlyD family secretion protein
MKTATPRLLLLVAAALVAGCTSEGRVADVSPGTASPAITPAAAAASAEPLVSHVPETDATGSSALGLDADPVAHDTRPSHSPDATEASIPGMLVADHKAAIGSQLTGQVAAVLVQEGETVRAGQPVIRLDDRALRLEVSEAAAAMEAARRRLVSGTTGTQVTANEVDQLVTQAEGDLQVALARHEAAEAAFQTAREQSAAEIAAAQAQLEAATARLTRLRRGSRVQEVAAARASVRAEEARLTRAADQAKRLQELFRQGAVAEEAVVTATSEERRLEADVAQAREQLALVEEGSRPEEISEAEAQQRAAAAQQRAAESSRRQVEQRRSELAAAQAQVHRAQAALRVARDSRVRVGKSRQDAASLASEVQLASTRLALARERLGQTVLRSPIAGQVIRRHVEPGDSVTADTRVLLEVSDPSSLHAEIAVTEAQLPALRVGLQVWVALPSRPGARLPGRVESLGSAPRGTAPGYVGRVRLSRLPRSARAGMLTNVYFHPQ